MLNLNVKYFSLLYRIYGCFEICLILEKFNEFELIRYDIFEVFIMIGIDNRSVNIIRGFS